MFGPESIMKAFGVSMPDLQAHFAKAQKIAADTVNHFEERCKQIIQKQDTLEIKIDTLLRALSQPGSIAALSAVITAAQQITIAEQENKQNGN